MKGKVLTLALTVLKIGRVAIITRGRYAGKKVILTFYTRRAKKYERDIHGNIRTAKKLIVKSHG